MPGPPPVARSRAEAELVADPYRSNYVIAIAARCAPQSVCTWRRELEAAGVIEHVDPANRIARPCQIPFRSRARTAIEAGAQLPEHLMTFGLSRGQLRRAGRCLARTTRWSVGANVRREGRPR